MRRTLSILSVLVLHVLMTNALQAQGTSGTLPEPISTHELKGYGDRLKLSPPQRQAAHAMHDLYKQEFRALRQGEISGFLKEMREMGGGMPKREKVESFLKNMDHLTGKIAIMDNRFFDQVQTVLTDEQLAQMPRVRMARQRVRYSASQMTAMAGTRPVDLSEIASDLELTEEQRQLIDPTLSQYEGKLTSSIAKLHDATTKMVINLYDALAERGFTEESMSDPETAGKMMAVMQEVWRDVMAKASEAGAAINDLNQRTHRSLAPLIPADAARQLRNRFYTRAYPQAGFALGGETYFHDAALKLEGLTAEQRDLLTAAKDEMLRKLDRLVEEAVTLIDQSTKDFSPFDFNSEAMQTFQQKLVELQKKVTEIKNAAMPGITAIIGEELAQRIPKGGQDDPRDVPQVAEIPGGAVAAASDAELSDGDESEMDDHNESDNTLPSAITKNDLSQYARTMKFTDEQSAVLSQLHANYLEKFRVIQDNEMAAVTKAMQAMWHWDETTNQSRGPTPEAVEDTHRLRLAAMSAVDNLDQSFFEDVKMAVLEDNQAASFARVQSARQRSVCNRGRDMYSSWMGGSNEARIDLSSFIQRQKLSETDLNLIDSDLIAYEEKATAAFKVRRDAAVLLQKAQELWQAEMAAARAEHESNPLKLSARYQELVGAASKSVNEHNRTIKQLNRETLERILPKLSVDAGHSVRRHFNLRAFPDVYNDDLSLEQCLLEAAKLDDLGAEQKRRLNEVTGEYRPAYAALCDQMVEISSQGETPSFTADDTEGWRKWQEAREAMGSLKFDRNELNLRAISQIRAILSEDHLRRIGGLPEPKKSESFENW